MKISRILARMLVGDLRRREIAARGRNRTEEREEEKEIFRVGLADVGAEKRREDAIGGARGECGRSSRGRRWRYAREGGVLP